MFGSTVNFFSIPLYGHLVNFSGSVFILFKWNINVSGIGIFQTHYKTVGRIQIGEPKQEFMVRFDTGGQWEIVCFDLTSENLGSPDFWIRSIECDQETCSKLFVFSFLPTCNKFLTKIYGIELMESNLPLFKEFFKVK